MDLCQAPLPATGALTREWRLERSTREGGTAIERPASESVLRSLAKAPCVLDRPSRAEEEDPVPGLDRRGVGEYSAGGGSGRPARDEYLYVDLPITIHYARRAISAGIERSALNNL